ncbi:MAG: ribonuclease P protein component [Bacteroidaceae bacterium]|nr:ribonuclease P protein component [Bacteroidaceae bacterium]
MEAPEMEDTCIMDRCQVLISVGKRKFKHAVDRNHAKRQMREAWRLNRDILIPSLVGVSSINIAFIWLAKEPQESEVVHRKMRNILHRIAEQISGSNSSTPDSE